MENNVDTIIGVNVTIKGSLKNKNSIEINGSVEGDVISDDHVTVGESAKIQGPVTAKTIVISGEVKGVIEATERLEINPTGVVIGDIKAKSLIIQQGATFVGSSLMPGESAAGSSPKKDDEKEIKEFIPTPKEIKEEKEEKEAPLKTEKEDKEDKKDDKEIIEDKFGFFSKK